MIYFDRQAEAETAARWNAKAKPSGCYERRSEYADEFIRRSGIMPGETVFDMGCGTGTLCLPLADDGHSVFAADFSDQMLAYLRETVEAEDNRLIRLQKMSFLEDWSAQDVPTCDLVFASRSLINLDPAVILPKLTAYAKRRVCITVHVDHRDGSLSGMPYKGKDRIAYFKTCLNTIIDMGYYPCVEYMECMFDGNRGWAFISWDV